MKDRADCAVVIPCFNEAGAIGKVVAGARRFVPRVVVVDDGSTDETAVLAEEAGAVVLRHETNRGKGAALRTGWKWALSAGCRWALFMDGDGQHSAEDMPAFFLHAEATGANLVIGNRMGDASRMPWLRRWVNRWMSRRISRLAGRSLADTQCGFRLVDLQSLKRLPVNAEHFEVESELLVRLAADGKRIEFVPVRVLYGGEGSKIRPLRDSVRWLRWYGRALLRGGRRFPPIEIGLPSGAPVPAFAVKTISPPEL